MAAADKSTYLLWVIMTQPKLLQGKNCKKKIKKKKEGFLQILLIFNITVFELEIR